MLFICICIDLEIRGLILTHYMLCIYIYISHKKLLLICVQASIDFSLKSLDLLLVGDRDLDNI